MITLLNQTQLYSVIGTVAILLIGASLFLFTRKAKPKKETIQIDDEYVKNLYFALGQKENILSITLENKRLKVMLKEPKIVDPEKFKQIDTPAFVVGKEIKILVKYSPEYILKKLDEIRNEGLKWNKNF